MINDQEYITTELKKVLEKMLILKSTRLNNLVAVIIGIIVSRSVILSNISQELKDCYSRGNEESKIKRIQRFLNNKDIDPESTYEFFVYKLLVELQKEKGIGILFICHDLALIKSFSHEIAVMYLGNIVENLPSDQVGKKTMHPYTNMLLESLFSVNMDRNKEINIESGEATSAIDINKGCLFRERCKFCKEICKKEKPQLKEIDKDHQVACHLF